MRNIPETSKEAFRSLDPERLTETKRKILYSLSQLFQATHEEIAAHMRVDRSIVWKRMNELEREGLVFKPGIKKALRSGRMGFVYQLSDKSLSKTQAAEKALVGHSIADYSRKITAIANSMPQQLNLYADQVSASMGNAGQMDVQYSTNKRINS